LAKIGQPGDLKFNSGWDAPQLDRWLRQILPTAFDLISESADHEYPLWLLKLSRSKLALHREIPDGYDAVSAKGHKGKGWQDSKLLFGKSLSILMLILRHNTMT